MKTYFSVSKPASAVLLLPVPASENMQRIMTFISATNDLAAKFISFHFSKIRRATLGGAAGQKVMLCTLTGGIVLNDLVIVQDVVNPLLFECAVMGAVAANVSYTLVANLVNTYSAGAYVYGCCITGATTPAEYAYITGAAQVEKSNASGVLVLNKAQACYVTYDACTATCNYIISGFMRS